MKERWTQPCEMAEWIRGGWKYIASSKNDPGCWLMKGDALLWGIVGRAVMCKYLEDKSPRSEAAVILITSDKLLIMLHSWEYKSLCSPYFLSNMPFWESVCVIIYRELEMDSQYGHQITKLVKNARKESQKSHPLHTRPKPPLGCQWDWPPRAHSDHKHPVFTPAAWSVGWESWSLRLFCPWDSSRSLLQGNFPTQGSNPGFLHGPVLQASADWFQLQIHNWICNWGLSTEVCSTGQQTTTNGTNPLSAPFCK